MLRSSSLWGAAPGVPNSPGVHADLPGGTLRYGISGADDPWHLDRLDSLGCGGRPDGWATRNGVRSVPACVPHLLPIGFGTMGQRQKLAAGVGFRATSSRNGGRHYLGMVGGWLARSTKTEPRLLR